MEIIVVDDGSTDDSRAILDRYAGKGVKCIHQSNRGQSAALNRCLEDARGEFVQYLDADDLLAPDKIALQIGRLTEHPGSIATAEWARFHDVPATARFEQDGPWQDMDPVDWLVENWKTGGGMMYPAMWLVPMSVVETIGPWREDLTLVNDTEYFTRSVLASRRVLFCKGARAYYRSGVPGSLSRRKARRDWESALNVISACEAHLLAREDSERTRRACAMLWQRLAHGCYPYCRSIANQALERAHGLHRDKLAPEGGPAFKMVASVLGWKIARVMQRLSGRP
jgi:glycosyltransferase involved in cell wall biosynthesis